MVKKIVFLTGTRADFGKIKSLINILEKETLFEVFIFVTGMHLAEEYGYTVIEVERCGFKNIVKFDNQTDESTMDLTLAKTIQGFSKFISKLQPDLIVVHGDRVEALAGAIVGSLNNILVAHIEGGEISGTIDELVRHSISKLSHIHFVANELAKKRLIQMGEVSSTVFVIGSPDIDIMFSNELPSIEEVKTHYQIAYQDYSIAMFHPVTTDIDNLDQYASDFVNVLIESGKNYVVIFPNNDFGSRKILKAYKAFEENPRFRVFPSIRFEYFLTLLKNAQLLIGNSSAGIREAPYYGILSINIGDRQFKRGIAKSIVHTSYMKEDISEAIERCAQKDLTRESTNEFGSGNSDEKFLELLTNDEIWNVPHQKSFIDIHAINSSN